MKYNFIAYPVAAVLDSGTTHESDNDVPPIIAAEIAEEPGQRCLVRCSSVKAGEELLSTIASVQRGSPFAYAFVWSEMQEKDVVLVGELDIPIKILKGTGYNVHYYNEPNLRMPVVPSPSSDGIGQNDNKNEVLQQSPTNWILSLFSSVAKRCSISNAAGPVVRM